jgi:hypothetical protein
MITDTFLTIILLSGTDANAGIQGVLPDFRIISQKIERVQGLNLVTVLESGNEPALEYLGIDLLGECPLKLISSHQ